MHIVTKPEELTVGAYIAVSSGTPVLNLIIETGVSIQIKPDQPFVPYYRYSYIKNHEIHTQMVPADTCFGVKSDVKMPLLAFDEQDMEQLSAVLQRVIEIAKISNWKQQGALNGISSVFGLGYNKRLYEESVPAQNWSDVKSIHRLTKMEFTQGQLTTMFRPAGYRVKILGRTNAGELCVVPITNGDEFIVPLVLKREHIDEGYALFEKELNTKRTEELNWRKQVRLVFRTGIEEYGLACIYPANKRS